MANPMRRKDPDSTMDFGFNWGDEWLESGDTIISSEWDVPSGITKESDENTTTTTTIWLSGGTAGESYTIKNTIETSDGRIDERSMDIQIENR